MLIQIVVLYMAYTYSLPTWCKVLVWIAIAINIFKLMCAFYDAGKENGR